MVNVGIVGATGMVGQTFIKVLEERKLPIANIYFFASAKSAGKKVKYLGKEYIVEQLKETSFSSKIDYLLFSAGSKISAKYALIAKDLGITVIDNSSCFRMESNVPLVVPEVNADALQSKSKIIANPNCSTIQCMLPLSVIAKNYGIKRIIYNTYQAVSGSGHKGIEDYQLTQVGKSPKLYPKPIYNNVLPHIDVFTNNGYTKEEMKMIMETKKILGDANIKVTATCVRVPALQSHSVSINVETIKPFTLENLKDFLHNSTGIVYYDTYPTLLDATNNDLVHIGRLRIDESTPNCLNMWVVSDNIRKGAATNAIQILEKMIGR